MPKFSRRSMLAAAGAIGFQTAPVERAAAAAAAADTPEAEARFRRRHPQEADSVWGRGASLIWEKEEARKYWEIPRNRFCYFRKTFALEHAVEHAQLRIVADTKYVLFVNGTRVGWGPSRFDPRWTYYDTYDIKHHLKPGKNAIAVLVLFHGYGTGAQISMMPMLLCDAEIALPNGRRLSIVTDRSWKSKIADAYDSHAPRVNGRLGPMEVVTLGRIPRRWTEIDFDDSEWGGTAAIRPGLQNVPWWNFVARDILPLREGQVSMQRVGAQGESEGAPPAVSKLGEVRPNVQWGSAPAPIGGKGERAATVVNLDFGRVEAGLLELELKAPAGGTVDAMYAEELWKGLVSTGSNSLIACDRFCLQPGVNQAAVQFGWRAFRYVQLWVWSDAPVEIVSAAIRTVGYPTPEIPAVRTSDERWNRISEIATHTLRLCMQDSYVDSSSREQQQWIGDGRKEAQTGFYLFGEKRLWRRLLDQTSQSQDWTGALMPRHPGRHENISPIPSYMLAWVDALWEYYWFTGDDSMMRDRWPNVVECLRWFTAFENGDGLLENVPHWAFIDHGEHPNGPGMDSSNEGISTPLNLMYLEALTLASRMAAVIGDARAADFCRAAARRLPPLLEKAWDAKRNAFVDRVGGSAVSEPTNVLALLHLPLRPGQAGAIISSVFEGRSGGRVVKGSPYFVLDTGRALSRHGRSDLAFRIFRERFGRMLDAGATSTWEMWDLFERSKKEPPGILSASHGWGAAVNTFFMESVLGVMLEAPGARRVVVRPQVRLLDAAEGQVMTARGPVKVGWAKSGEKAKLQIEAPDGSDASVELPGRGRVPFRERFSELA